MPAGRSFRVLLTAVIAAATLAVIASGASAACPRGAECGRVTVPLDHSGATPGTLSLAYAKVRATDPATGTLVLLSGGPGQSAIPLTSTVTSLLEPLRDTYDLVMVDQRGTGSSGAVNCPLERRADVAACAARLGDRRAFFNTPETARDLEDLRVQLGVPKLTLLGVSYGAKVAGEYARRYPERTAAVVLDSPTPIDGLDELRALGMPRVLREVCFPGLCSATVSDPEAALRRAVERLRRGPVSGKLVRLSGGARTLKVSESDLYEVLSASDVDPRLRVGLPAAIASLAAGDAAPLLHLGALSGASGGGSGGVNTARLLATACIEGRLPWAPDSPVASRSDALKAFIAARQDAFAPFSTGMVLNSSVTWLCGTWPSTPRPEGVPYRGPDVPVLVLSGREDLRTPLEDARRTAAQYPNATLLAIPGVGHSVLTSDFSACSLNGLVAFLRGRDVETCTEQKARASVNAAPYAPASIDRLPPTQLSGLPGRTISALAVTLTGAGYDATFATRSPARIPGLRGGYVRVSRSSLQLHDAEWIRGVRVTGRFDPRGRGTLTVSGPAAAAGTVTYTARGARGVLGGRSFELRG